ncbi:hypothetical protein [Cupriavidus basilensis]|uniref:hypothetical protein n=1 Tax=Cupriavidus basilensis TaxID=68895 RepID=UPI001300C1F9|nr:hypothetical protein [Cupriavidus basilensis]
MDSLANGKDIDRWTATNEATAGVTTTVAAARPEQYGRVPKIGVKKTALRQGMA